MNRSACSLPTTRMVEFVVAIEFRCVLGIQPNFRTAPVQGGLLLSDQLIPGMPLALKDSVQPLSDLASKEDFATKSTHAKSQRA